MKKLALTLLAASVSLLASCASSSSGSSDDNINPVIKDKSYPSAHPYKKNIVISPYRPHNLINVKGIKPGHFARDMSTADKGSDGKPIVSSAKIFKVPVAVKAPVAQ